MSGYSILTGTLFMYMNCVDATWDKICTEISNFLENRIPMQLNLKLYGF